MRFLKSLFNFSSDGSRTPSPELVTGLQQVNQVQLPRALADETQQHLRAAGQTGNEGMVVWTGIQEDSIFKICTITVPRQRGIRSAEGVCVVVDGDALHELNVATFRRGERLFAQIHTHPGRAYHSPMDDQYAIITAPGGLSLVVPDFAVRSFSVAECAIYRLSRQGSWDAVTSSDATNLIRLLEGRGS